MKKPLIGLACDYVMDGHRPFHRVNEKYATAVIDAIDGIPLLIPALASRTTADTSGMEEKAATNLDTAAMLAHLDGILLPGSYSNVAPVHYGETSRPNTLHDPHRDSLTLSLILQAIALGVPLLAICRGFQEMNVAYGGSLYQHVHELSEHLDHRENLADPVAVQYGHAHTVALTEGGVLASTYGKQEAWVNSLHSQGVKDLGTGLIVEATAPDGLIEAISDPHATAFNLAVQWHPEYQVANDDFYTAIFSVFGDACRKRLACRLRE